jgi:hypothetical protein
MTAHVPADDRLGQHEPGDQFGPQPPWSATPLPVDIGEHAVTMFERILTVVKNIIVIITCAVILFAVYNAYAALQRLGEGLSQIGS